LNLFQTGKSPLGDGLIRKREKCPVIRTQKHHRGRGSGEGYEKSHYEVRRR